MLLHGHAQEALIILQLGNLTTTSNSYGIAIALYSMFTEQAASILHTDIISCHIFQI